MAKNKDWGNIRKKMEAETERHMLKTLAVTCDNLIEHALQEREFSGFTGNTQTSYSCGIYKNGKLIYVVSAGKELRKPVRKKIPLGKRVFLKRPYEGPPRAVKGKVKVDSQYGQYTAEDFLESYKNVPKKGFAIVMTTGTEYSEYLENLVHLNVLGETYSWAKDILMNSITPIK